VPVSRLMASFVRAAIDAARMTDGIVDPTLLSEIEHAGYDHDLSTGAGLETILELAPARRPASPSPLRKWEQVRLISNPPAVQRPIGLRLDSGGIVKGLLADLISCSLGQSASYAIDCSGDLRIGGRAGTPRAVNVQSPFHDGVIHRYELSDAGVATSGIGRRSWLGEDRTPMHHLLDPASGRAAFTGIVQVTALAPTAFEAEVRAKAALLSGVDRAAAWLVHGGTVVYEDGDFDVF
jgi:thiamine biosynthesis lipoprotein